MKCLVLSALCLVLGACDLLAETSEIMVNLKLSAALDYIGRIAPRRAYLIHMCHDFTHEEWLKKLPKGVEPAYDGLEIEV